MGGSINVESVYGEGSCFTAEVIQKIVSETPIGDYKEHLSNALDINEEFKPRLVAPDAKILIVDDNEMNLEVITGLLEDTRISVTTALSGRECIEILEQKSFDMVFLDQMMPELSGTRTLEIINEKHLCENTPVIVLTADAIVGARESYVKAGFADYLSKPVMYPELEDMLMKYLDQKLLLTKDEIEAEEQRRKEEREKYKPRVLVISDSEEKLRLSRSLISEEYKGVFVRNTAQAKKYLEKHEAAFIIRDIKDFDPEGS